MGYKLHHFSARFLAHVGDSLNFDYLNAREAGIQAFYLDRKKQNGHDRALKNLLDLKDIYQE